MGCLFSSDPLRTDQHLQSGSVFGDVTSDVECLQTDRRFVSPISFPFRQDACAALLHELRMEVQCGEESLTKPAAGGAGDVSSDAASGFILVIDGRTLDWALQEEPQSDFLELSRHCKAVICCRSTPLQKSQVVQLIRDKLRVMTLAVGEDADPPPPPTPQTPESAGLSSRKI